MNVIKALLTGAVASLVMAVIMSVLIQQGIAPFKLPPSAAFSHRLGLSPQPTGMILHFVYGMVLSLIFVYLFRQSVNLTKGLMYAVVVWLVMMVAISPIIGWGAFGWEAGQGKQASIHYLASMPRYLVATLLLHLVYGAIIGWLNGWWLQDR